MSRRELTEDERRTANRINELRRLAVELSELTEIRPSRHRGLRQPERRLFKRFRAACRRPEWTPEIFVKSNTAKGLLTAYGARNIEVEFTPRGYVALAQLDDGWVDGYASCNEAVALCTVICKIGIGRLTRELEDSFKRCREELGREEWFADL